MPATEKKGDHAASWVGRNGGSVGSVKRQGFVGVSGMAKRLSGKKAVIAGTREREEEGAGKGKPRLPTARNAGGQVRPIEARCKDFIQLRKPSGREKNWEGKKTKGKKGGTWLSRRRREQDLANCFWGGGKKRCETMRWARAPHSVKELRKKAGSDTLGFGEARSKKKSGSELFGKGDASLKGMKNDWGGKNRHANKQQKGRSTAATGKGGRKVLVFQDISESEQMRPPGGGGEDTKDW